MKISLLFTIPSAIISFAAGVVTIISFITNAGLPNNVNLLNRFHIQPSMYIFISAYLCSILIVWVRILYERNVIKSNIKKRNKKHEGMFMLLCTFSLWALFYIPCILSLYAEGYTSKIVIGLPLGTVFVAAISAFVFELLHPYKDSLSIDKK